MTCIESKIFDYGMPLTSIIEALEQKNQAASSTNYISVVSFNLLAPLYVRPIDKRTGQVQPFAAFEWVQEDNILDWESRKLRLLDCLSSNQAQVICLQELQLERYEGELNLPKWLIPMLEQYKYEATLPPQDKLEDIASRNVRVLGSDSAVTCAVLVKTNEWNIIREELKTSTAKKEFVSDNNTCVTVCLKHKSNPGVDPLVIASVHLDATNEQKRVSLLTKCFARARFLLKNASSQQFNNDEKMRILPLTAIISGDMNAEFLHGSCLSAILKDYDSQQVSESDTVEACRSALRLQVAPNENQIKEWKELEKDACQSVKDYCVSLDRVDLGPTRCAYNHEEEDSSEALETWKLDHMLYTTDRLIPLARWSTLESDQESIISGLPNYKIPSDHLPIATVFELKPTSSLPPIKRTEILDKLKEISTTQTTALKTLESTMETKREEILKLLASRVVDPSSQEPATEVSSCKNPKKKKKKGPPPKEIIELTREKRAQLRQLQKELRSEREQLVASFGNLERLLIEEHFGVSWRKWVENES